MMRFNFLLYCLPLISLMSTVNLSAQQRKTSNRNLVYVDKDGVLRYTSTKAEAAFFGVNYTVPFAYGYRSHKKLNVDIERAIDQDVYHFSRLKLDAFRVHVWDTEISDSAGNLLDNEHLRLFDYLLAKLKERNIKILITPIAFWGNGYPEKDENTSSFVSKYGKGPSVVLEAAIVAQERYVAQFFRHVNPYTGLTYGNDPDVIAMEINNEPHHSGKKERTTEYINRLAAAVRSTGWTKPVFYNISESPAYADAVAKAKVDGFSFQWYPTGLVANRTLQGNYLPNVDQYKIPFGDTIPQFANKALMVYEFDAGDVFQSNMYPAMARSFRSAGFQWATQFAYDPIATAYGNTEYQTHYLNLAYTPSKAISLMIASRAFHLLPRLKTYGTYPADSVFGAFRVSYGQNLSEMNSAEEFYYSNNISSTPVQPLQLRHVAGVGSSPLVQYHGTGAYFIDKLADGIWRLEMMPDAIHVSDPFAKASPSKVVTHINWQVQPITITLPGLADDFSVVPLDSGNTFSLQATAGAFSIRPGSYLLQQKGKTLQPALLNSRNLPEFVAPKASLKEVAVIHTPANNHTENTPLALLAEFINLAEQSSVQVEVRNTAGKWRTLQMQHTYGRKYSTIVPADMVTSGLINYRFIVLHANGTFVTFPGNHQGDPFAWDNVQLELWETRIVAKRTPLYLFYPTNDRSHLNLYNPDWKSYAVSYTSSERPGELQMRTTVSNTANGKDFGWHLFVGDKLKQRGSALSDFKGVVVRATTNANEPIPLKVSLINVHGVAFSKTIMVSKQAQEFAINLADLEASAALLLPRPYPGFLPLHHNNAGTTSFTLNETDKLELLFQQNSKKQHPYDITVEAVYLK